MTFDPPEWFLEATAPTRVGLDAYPTMDAHTFHGGDDSYSALLDGVVFDGDGDIIAPPELVQDTLPLTGVAFLGGQSGAGKTFIAVDLTLAVCEERQFLGRRVRERVGVALIASEGAGTLAARTEAARIHREAQTNLPLATITPSGSLNERKQIDQVIRTLRAINERLLETHSCRLGVVIIDTLAAAFSMKDENSNAEAATIMRELHALSAATGTLVVAVHHYGKAQETGLRGASAFRASADAVISILASRDELTGESRDRSVVIAKSRSSTEGPIADFELVEVPLGINRYGEAFGSCAVSVVERRPKSKRPTNAQRLFRESFDAALVDHGRDHRLNNAGPVVRAITVDELRTEYLRRKVTAEDDPKSQREAALRALRRTLGALPADFSTEVAVGKEWIWRTASDAVDQAP